MDGPQFDIHLPVEGRTFGLFPVWAATNKAVVNIYV